MTNNKRMHGHAWRLATAMCLGCKGYLLAVHAESCSLACLPELHSPPAARLPDATPPRAPSDRRPAAAAAPCCNPCLLRAQAVILGALPLILVLVLGLLVCRAAKGEGVQHSGTPPPPAAPALGPPTARCSPRPASLHAHCAPTGCQDRSPSLVELLASISASLLPATRCLRPGRAAGSRLGATT